MWLLCNSARMRECSELSVGDHIFNLKHLFIGSSCRCIAVYACFYACFYALF